MHSKLFLAVAPLVFLACSDPGATGAAGGGAGTGGMNAGGGAPGQCADTLALQAASNYTFSSEIKLTPAAVKPKSELTFDWSGLTTDFLGRPTNPGVDINSVLLVVFNLTLQGLADTLNADDGSINSKTAGALQLITKAGATSASIYDFGVPGTPENTYRTDASVKTSVDEYLDPAVNDPASHVIAVLPSNGTELGRNLRTIQALTLDPMSSVTAVSMAGSTRITADSAGHSGGTAGPSASVTYDVDLQHLTPVRVPAGKAALTVDWSQLTDNGLGNPWLARSISRAFVGHYSQSLAELEKQFLDLETIATDIYAMDVDSDAPVSLAGLKDAAGQAFTGVDATGVWILALSCSAYCSSPAPWYLTVLQPCN